MKTPDQGFTLVEIVLGAVTLAIVTSAVLGAYVGQVTLNEHARNLSLAVQDANRVIEAIREDNAGCTTPDIVPDDGSTSWDQWMSTGGAGEPKSIGATPDTDELLVVTCQNNPRPPPDPPPDPEYCGDVDQVGAGEWVTDPGVNSNYAPLRVTVAVCWRHRSRTIGECAWDGAALLADDAGGDNDGIVDSPAMLTTLVTCR